MSRLILTGMMVLVLGACAVTGPTAGLPDADSEAVKIYAAYCGACHGLPHPGRHNSAEWAAVMSIMEQRMLERDMTPPNHNDRQTILGYLQAHAR